MREAGLAHVVDELFGEFLVRQALSPRGEVYLVRRYRRMQPVGLAPSPAPLAVGPVVVGGEHDRSGCRRVLGVLRDRVGLLPPDAVRAEDVVLVLRSVAD